MNTKSKSKRKSKEKPVVPEVRERIEHMVKSVVDQDDVASMSDDAIFSRMWIAMELHTVLDGSDLAHAIAAYALLQETKRQLGEKRGQMEVAE